MKKILLIEDDHAFAEVCKAIIDEIDLDVEIDITHDHMGMLSKLTNNLYDIVIVDYHLPGPNGVMLMHQIRSFYDRPIPVLFITADTNKSIKDEAMKNGANAFIVKCEANEFANKLLPEIKKYL